MLVTRCQESYNMYLASKSNIRYCVLGGRPQDGGCSYTPQHRRISASWTSQVAGLGMEVAVTGTIGLGLHGMQAQAIQMEQDTSLWVAFWAPSCLDASYYDISKFEI